MIKKTIVLLPLFFILSNPVSYSLTLESRALKTSLLELFSSEGCSGCPPAEEWMQKLKGQSGLWTQFVPAQFHVDYWDDLGWKDEFASPQYTERQRRYVDSWKAGVLYTPGFVFNGEEWEGWRDAKTLPEIPAEEVGVLKVENRGTNDYQITFDPATQVLHAWKVFGALLGFGMVTDVKAGENKGKRLEHDFVVLDYNEGELQAKGDLYTATLQLRSLAELPVTVPAIAVWVTKGDDPAPVQAVGGYLEWDLENESEI